MQLKNNKFCRKLYPTFADVSDNIKYIIESSEYLKDKLISLLFNEETENSNLYYPNEYKVFSDYLEGLSDLNSFRTFMSDKWYEGCKELSWFDSHKSSEDVYTGYWSWVAGACLKLKGDSNVQINYVPVF